DRCAAGAEDQPTAQGHSGSKLGRGHRCDPAHLGRALRPFPPAGGADAMNALIIARKEIHHAIRNRWVLASTLLLAGLSLSLTFLGSAPTGSVGVQALDVVIVSLSSLTIFLVPLIALLISHDAIVGDMERGTMLLLLSYPVARWQVLLGKFVGHLSVLGFATLLGYGVAAGALIVSGSAVGPESWAAFIAMVGSSVLLGAVFIAVGYLVSALVRDRGTATGIAVGIWLLLVLIY